MDGNVATEVCMTLGTYLFPDPEHVSAMSKTIQVLGQANSQNARLCTLVRRMREVVSHSLFFFYMAFIVREVKSQNRVPGLPRVN